LLNEQANPKQIEAKLPAMLEKHRGNAALDKFILQPVKDIHLHSQLDYEAEVNGSGETVRMLGLIAFIIVFIAWVNYINLSTARSIDRAKEVGIRKVMGSARISIVKQFIFEALLMNLISAIFALTLAQLGLPLINVFTGWDLPSVNVLEMLAAPVYGIKYPFILLFVVGSLLSAIYPALVLSAYTPGQVLKGVFRNSTRGVVLRKSLVVFQFAASVLLIAGTLLAYQQLSFMLNGNLGVNINQTIVVDAPNIHVPGDAYNEQLQVFENELLQNPKISAFSVSSDVPGKPIGSSRGGVRRESVNEFVGTRFNIAWVDEGFFPNYQISFVAGRNFSKDRITDIEQGIILNERACKLIGFESPEAAIGQNIIVGGQDKKKVVGVIADYHQHSLKEDHDPVLYEYARRNRNYFSIKIGASNMPEAIVQVQKKYEATFPENPFTYFFLDTFYEEQYKADRQFLKTFGLFAGLALLVACLGLFALSSFTIVQRQKEIGVRKVLGASTLQVQQLLYRDMLLLIVLANLIALPLAYLGIRQWLQNYAFHIDFNAWLLIIPSLVVILIAVLTISSLAMKAARENPVKALKYE
jgi:putative ABC transport system permease protein